MLSNRVKKLISSPSEIVEAHVRCMSDPFQSESNPNGYLNFGTAQNYLMTDMIQKSLDKPTLLSEGEIHYNEAYGLGTFRKVLKNFLEKYLKLTNINEENLVVQSGASAICESLSFSLFDEGDSLIIPSPYYIGFNHDFAKRFGVDIIKVHLNPDHNFRLDADIIEESIKKAQSNGKKIKAILITNPHNPTGTIRSKQELLDIVEVAKKYDLQLISDEIYGLSTFGNGEYTSLLEIAPDYRHSIHFIYGMAKDMTLSGFKVGVYYTENKQALEAMQAVSYFHTVSTHTQKYLEGILSDESFMDEFISNNKKKLKEVNEYIQSNISYPVCENEAGIFFFMNLSKLLKENTFAEELKLFQYIINEMKLSITPGQFFNCKEPGWFRVCFAMPMDYAKEFIKRINNVKDYK